MFCPRCSEPKADESTQFCTKCGLNLAALEAFVASDRRPGLDRAIKQGLLLFIIGLLLIPVYVFIGPLFPPNDVLVESSASTTPFEQIVWTVMWLFFLAAGARIAFGYSFERGKTNASDNGKRRDDYQDPAQSPDMKSSRALGANSVPENRRLREHSILAEEMIGRWKTTAELVANPRKPLTSGELL